MITVGPDHEIPGEDNLTNRAETEEVNYSCEAVVLVGSDIALTLAGRIEDFVARWVRWR